MQFVSEFTVHHADVSPKITSLDAVMEMAGPVTELPESGIKQGDTAALLYSSGTTGLSKGVVLTHGNFIAAAVMIGVDDDLAGEVNDVFLCVLPMFHVFGLVVVTYTALRRGSAVVMMAKFELEAFLNAIEKHRVTKLWLVPPILLAMVKQQGVVGKYNLSSLKRIGSGAAPLGKELMEECGKRFPHVVVCQVTYLLSWSIHFLFYLIFIIFFSFVFILHMFDRTNCFYGVVRAMA